MPSTDSPAPGGIAAIRVEGVGKIFRTWASPAQRLIVPLLHRIAGYAPGLRHRLQASIQRRIHVHEALHDISFELARGEALGIVGLNGSGKSTLLQIIAGVLPPTSGSVRTHGRIAALLELGSGFNPELTGRENIQINATILGLSRERIDAVLDDIIAFADIGDYIDQPVKTYSSGMAVRLAFAVQVHVEPDILIVDEALAVGDAAFQAKALARIQQILANGTTLLFVGHDLNVVRAFCQRAILLEAGRIARIGSPEEVVEEYLFRVHAKAARDQASPVRSARGFRSADGEILDMRFAHGSRHLSLAHGAALPVEVDIALAPAVANVACIVDIVDARGLPLSGRRIRIPEHARASGRVRLAATFRAELALGVYRIRARLVQAPEPNQHHARVLCRYDSDLSFDIVDNSIERFSGLVPLPVDIALLDLPADAGD